MAARYITTRNSHMHSVTGKRSRADPVTRNDAEESIRHARALRVLIDPAEAAASR